MDQPMTIVPTADLDRLFGEIRELRTIIEGATIAPRPEWLTVAEFAEMIGKSTRTVKRRIDSGELETRNIAGTTMVRAPKT